MRIFNILLLAVLGASGPWRAAAVVVPPAGTNRVVLTWGSLGTGTRYYVQTSTNFLTWAATTNTTATNVSLTFIADKARMFRLSASNAPLRSVTLAWDPSPGTNAIAGYRVYYGASSATYTNMIAAGTNTTVSISNLVSGTTYYFTATAVDDSALESDYSNEVVWEYSLGLRIQRVPQ
jgi:fibronectin type 3 domain-containing protein